jgi:hypothetical protein
MKKLQLAFALLVTSTSFGQTERKSSAFLSIQANKTIADRTITNNAGGIGLGLQTALNTGTWVKPALEINADLFAGTKELYIAANGDPIDAKSGVLRLYAGPMLQPTKRLFLTTTAGASIYHNEIHFGVRPSVGFYLSKNQRGVAKTSYTNVFQRDNISQESFRYLSFSLAVKLF